jgi:hypothetical protein
LRKADSFAISMATVGRHKCLHPDQAHDPEKWDPVSGKDHAQAKC